MNEMLPVEALERLLELPLRTFENAAPVFLILLTMDLRQREFPDLRIVFQKPEKIAGFNRIVLPGIAHEQHAVIVFPRQFQDLITLAQRIQTGFVDDDIRPFRRLFRGQKEARNRLRLLESFLLQNLRCGVGRSHHNDVFHASGTQSAAELLKRRSLPGTRHSAEQIEPVRRRQQPRNQFGLSLPRRLIRERNEARSDRLEDAFLVFHRLNRTGLPLDHFLG